ncbi:cation transporter [Candidatus Saccharibacteria bacterium]|nr:cation transporter [Candidatus Saccharibacteria bacterium]
MRSDKRILIAFLLNTGFAIFAMLGAILTGSMSLLADLVHNLGDAISVGIAYFLEHKSHSKKNEKYTYGYLRYSVLGALITNIILVVGAFLVIHESIERIISPEPIDHEGMLIFAIIGVIISTIAARVTHGGESLNQKAVSLHMLQDILSWGIVLIGSIIIRFTNLEIVDSILPIIVSVYILYNAARNLKFIADIFLLKVPANVNMTEMRKHIKNVKGVLDIHHIHVWSIDGVHNFATLHIKVKKYDAKIKEQIRAELEEHNVIHSTIEFETENEACVDRDDEMAREKMLDLHLHHHH